MVTVLLADDQPLVRAGLALLLDGEADLEVIGEAGDGREAVELARRIRPDVVVMDVRMPVLDGVEASRAIVAERAARVLVLTTYHVGEAVYAALRAGASGFILKDAAPAELAAAVRAVAAGQGWLHPPVAGRIIADIAAGPAIVGPGLAPDRLTAREREILTLMAHGLSNSEIAARLVIGGATVKTHVGSILMKLGLRDRAQAIAAAYQGGLVRASRVP